MSPRRDDAETFSKEHEESYSHSIGHSFHGFIPVHADFLRRDPARPGVVDSIMDSDLRDNGNNILHVRP